MEQYNTIENSVAAAILEKSIGSINIDGVIYEIAPPSTATLILISEIVSTLPVVNKVPAEDIVTSVLHYAQYYRPIGEVFPDADIRIKGGDASKPEMDPEYADVRIKGKTRRIRLFPNRDYCEVNGKRCPLPGICIYNGVDFYLPEAGLWLE